MFAALGRVPFDDEGVSARSGDIAEPDAVRHRVVFTIVSLIAVQVAILPGATRALNWRIAHAAVGALIQVAGRIGDNDSIIQSESVEPGAATVIGIVRPKSQVVIANGSRPGDGKSFSECIGSWMVGVVDTCGCPGVNPPLRRPPVVVAAGGVHCDGERDGNGGARADGDGRGTAVQRGAHAGEGGIDHAGYREKQQKREKSEANSECRLCNFLRHEIPLSARDTG